MDTVAPMALENLGTCKLSEVATEVAANRKPPQRDLLPLGPSGISSRQKDGGMGGCGPDVGLTVVPP